MIVERRSWLLPPETGKTFLCGGTPPSRGCAPGVACVWMWKSVRGSPQGGAEDLCVSARLPLVAVRQSEGWGLDVEKRS